VAAMKTAAGDGYSPAEFDPATIAADLLAWDD
jgi:hypothetical protein